MIEIKKKYTSTIGKMIELGWDIGDWTHEAGVNLDEPVIINMYEDGHIYIDFPFLDPDNNIILKGKHNLEGLEEAEDV